jgi:hypothetical protein
VGGLPKDLQFTLIEPFRELFKDEVRQVGRLLGVPDQFIRRHPFPGPGLAVRVLGDVTEGNKLDVLREADEIFINAIREYGLYDEIWQVGGGRDRSHEGLGGRGLQHLLMARYCLLLLTAASCNECVVGCTPCAPLQPWMAVTGGAFCWHITSVAAASS